MMTIADNIARVQEEIATACARVNRSTDEVKLIAISKQKPSEAIVEAVNAGLQHFGENFAEMSKIDSAPSVRFQIL